MIATLYGDMDEATLEKREGTVDNERECTTWVEYRRPGSDEVIHRSVHVRLKRMPAIQVEAGGII